MPQESLYMTDAERQKAYRERQKAARLEEQRIKGLPAAPAISTLPSRARWNALLANASALLTTARDEMETYRDERSESWQESEAAELLQAKIDAIETAIAALEELE